MTITENKSIIGFTNLLSKSWVLQPYVRNTLARPKASVKAWSTLVGPKMSQTSKRLVNRGDFVSCRSGEVLDETHNSMFYHNCNSKINKNPVFKLVCLARVIFSLVGFLAMLNNDIGCSFIICLCL